MQQRTEAQIAAARANGAKSRGPVTEAGKAASSANSLTHGLTARAVVLATEDPDQFNAFLAEMIAEFAPETTSQLLCVEEMTVAQWKSRRIWALESATLGLKLDQPLSPAPTQALDSHGRLSLAWNGVQRQLDNFAWHDARLHRQYNRALAQLERLQARAKKKISENEPGNQAA